MLTNICGIQLINFLRLNMVNEKIIKKVSSKYEDEIAKAEEKLRLLKSKQQEEIKKQQERSFQSIIEYLKLKKLDAVPLDKWKEQMPNIKALLIE